MKVRTLLIISSSAFVVLLGIVFVTTVSLFGDRGDARYINLAGRQRMLTQKVSNDTLNYAAAPTTENSERLQATVSLFDTTHAGLRGGGKVATDLEATNFVDITAPDDSELLRKLDVVDIHWTEMKEAVRTLEKIARQRVVAEKQLAETTSVVLASMNEAVRLMAEAGDVSPVTVDLAGRQRMLGEKVAKEALIYAGNPTAAQKNRLELSVAVFKTTHGALRDGGLAPRKLDNTDMVKLGRPGSPAIAKQLDAVGAAWTDQRAAVTALVEATDAQEKAMEDMRARTPKVLETMNDAVNLAQKLSDARASSTIVKVQIGSLAIGLLFALGSVVLAVKIGSSLKTLQNAAEDISEGTLDRVVRPTGIGEIRSLSESFERMRVSLQQTMQMLDADV